MPASRRIQLLPSSLSLENNILCEPKDTLYNIPLPDFLWTTVWLSLLHTPQCQSVVLNRNGFRAFPLFVCTELILPKRNPRHFSKTRNLDRYTAFLPILQWSLPAELSVNLPMKKQDISGRHLSDIHQFVPSAASSASFPSVHHAKPACLTLAEFLAVVLADCRIAPWAWTSTTCEKTEESWEERGHHF